MKVKVLSNINSGQYGPGDVAEFDESEAQQLIEAGVATAYEQEGDQSPTAADENETTNDTQPTEAQVEQTDPEKPADLGGAPAAAPLDEAPAAPQVPSQEAVNEQPTGFPESLADGNPTPEQIAQDIANLDEQEDKPAA